MVTVYAQILMEETRRGVVAVAMDAHHAGSHATKAELAAVNSFIEAMKATTALSAQLHEPRRAPRISPKLLTLPNKEKTKRRKRNGNTAS
jgi:hypothetical protein